MKTILDIDKSIEQVKNDIILEGPTAPATKLRSWLSDLYKLRIYLEHNPSEESIRSQLKMLEDGIDDEFVPTAKINKQKKVLKFLLNIEK